MSFANSYFEGKLQQRKEQQRFRQLRTEKEGIDLSSNDYLGLAQHLFAVETSGSTGSRLLSGNCTSILTLEEQLAHFYNAESALLFPTGFQANIGLLSSLGQRGDTYLLDSNIHASMKEGARLSNCQHWKFKHNDLDDLTNKLSKAKGNVWVFVEALYSMDGSIAPLKEIASICKKHNAALVVDEAHSNAIFGERGHGLVSHLALEHQVTARVMTFGKGFGAEGATIVGSHILKSFLVNFCSSFIYSTAPSRGFCESLTHQLKAVINASDRRRLLTENIQLFNQLKKTSQFNWNPSTSPIHSLAVGDALRTKQLANFLRAEGFYVFPILSPTVEEGKEQIRFCLHSFNTQEQLEALFKLLSTAT